MEDTPVRVTGRLIAALALMTAVAPLALDMYLPAFPAMAQELGTTATGVQLTLTACLAGLGLGQLFIGPMSDALGRRRLLLLGTAICAVTGVACALAPNVELLALGRFLQGLSGAAGVVLARSVVSDTSRGQAAARLLGVLMIINVVAPVVAPLSGGAIVAFASWRAVFWVQAALALLASVCTLVWVRESLPKSARARGGLSATFSAVRETLTSRTYVAYLLTFCFAFAALFAYISASPFVMQQVIGLSSGMYSLLFGLNALVVVATSAVAAALAGRVPYRRMIAVGLTVAVLSAVGLAVCVSAGVPTVPTLVLFAVFQGSMGPIFANATTLALAETGKHAGTGSAFLGFLQFLLAAAISPLVGIAGENSAAPMVIAILVSIALATVAFAVLPDKSTETERENSTEGDLSTTVATSE
ncbi:multidrug effflux MFS transporter [Streptomyces sp. NPDC002790]|uniref:multidrug effflux MFS transporter n=1 Tax=Streptomyces sp. NPDC002790 TaxID=3154431 RepID=UPI00332DB35A